ncbi:amino acid adenylation domain-containing protein [Streptomyces californicus]|uniref:non-ribosomal peptide synthetase n=1 Tax=Streptomyces californicus TaxID=67351 RepID=UPI0036D81D94
MTELSTAQRRLFHRWRHDPADGTRNVSLVLCLRGLLDRDRLRSAVLALLDRHEVLRSRFPVTGGHPGVEVRPTTEFKVESSEAHGNAVTVAEAYVRAGFDLTVAAVRAALIEAGPAEHLLVLAAHPIIADHASMDILCAELTEAFGRGGAATTRPATVDVVSSPVERQAFWRSVFDGVDPSLDLPTDRPRPAFSSQRRANMDHWLPGESARRVAEVSEVDTATVLLAAFGILLRRYTGKSDLVVGVLVDTLEEGHRVGTSTGAVPARLLVDGGQRANELLKHTHAARAVAHRHAPAEAVGAVPHQVGLAFRQPARAPQLPGLDVERLELGPATGLATAGLDLALSVVELPEGLRIDCDYDAEVFGAERISRLFGHLERVLDGMAAAPGSVVAALPMLTEAEEQRAARTWNATEVDYPAGATLPRLVAEQIAAAPDAVALRAEEDEVTYAALDRWADRLAARLLTAGVSRGDVVGVVTERTPELVAALLAVLRAGAAYLPLDPAYPDERLRLMLADARARVVLTTAGAADRISADGLVLVPVGSDGGSGPVGVDLPVTDPADLCYVIYTSGSTGRPKGVLLDQRGRVNNFTTFNQRFRVGAGDSVLSVAALGFDMTVYDVFGPLIAGATLVLSDPDRDRDPVHWLDLMTTHRVTVWHSVPALLDMLLFAAAELGVTALPDLRLVLLGGDWIPVDLADRVRALSPDAEVISLGGATEVSVDSMFYPIGEVDPRWPSIPYGRPGANQRAYVLDVDGHLAPVGVPGELYLGGLGLAWGYAGAGAQTAARFSPDPYAVPPGGRRYATGDLARYQSDGTLELLGRADLQVKIGGARIELGEVEAVLRELPEVSSAVAAPHRVNGIVVLVGYVVPEPGADLDAAGVRRRLARRLPAFMVPAVIVLLDRLPLTPNGKVDRKHLPPPHRTDS